MQTDRIQQHFIEAQRVLDTFLSNEENMKAIADAGEAMVSALKNGGKIMSCGNGGSYCDAMHFAEELTGRYRENRAPFAALALSDGGHMSCVSNDYGYAHVFERMVHAIGQSNDVLLAISTSGNSENILLATQAAKRKNITVVALTGKDGGALAGLADVEIRAPKSPYADRAQEIHIKVIHALIDYIEHNMWNILYTTVFLNVTMATLTEHRYRLRKNDKIVGYMRKVGKQSYFYSRDAFWWTGRQISYDEIDEWTGLYDKNRTPIYEWDILHFKIDPDGDYAVGVILWQADQDRFVIRKVDEDLYFPLFLENLQLFDQRQLEVFTYLFLNPDLKHYLGLDD